MEDGAWDKSMRAKLRRNENILAAIEHNRQNNFGHYLLNPFVSGPVAEILTRVKHGIQRGVYSALRDRDSLPADKIKPTVKIDPRKKDEAWNIEHDVREKALKDYSNEIDKLKIEHPGQYYLNPFTAGPLNQIEANLAHARVKNIRQVFSPTTKAGDTLKNNKKNSRLQLQSRVLLFFKKTKKLTR